MMQQLSWLTEEPLTSENLIRKDVRELQEKQNNLRRGLFQRYDELYKEVQELRGELSSMKKESHM